MGLRQNLIMDTFYHRLRNVLVSLEREALDVEESLLEERADISLSLFFPMPFPCPLQNLACLLVLQQSDRQFSKLSILSSPTQVCNLTFMFLFSLLSYSLCVFLVLYDLSERYLLVILQIACGMTLVSDCMRFKENAQ